ncbi:MAG: UDP-glucose 4-epimerase GalE [Candidatus Izemoplasmatales bacterium]|nr:UDP-glucose 4-epimerase GalE [Candidatus Izemoplasmatales bacterium]
MKILVTGGAGYIGSHFVKVAIEQHHHVVVVDNLVTGHIEAIHPEARFFMGDIRDRAFLDDVFLHEQFDACVHFAAHSLVGESMREPLLYFDNNVYGTICLIEAMAKHHVEALVFSSSAAVYGVKEEMPISESAHETPANPYGESKLMMERMIRWAEHAHHIRYVSLRYFNVAGAVEDGSIGEDHFPETHLIPNVLQVALGHKPEVIIFGQDYETKDGTCIRDYIHVLDLVDAHLRALEYLHAGHHSEIINLGSEQGYSNLEIVHMARQVTHMALPFRFGDRRPGDPKVLIALNAKAEKILHWKPQRGLESIISSAWRFHQRFPSGYQGGQR